MTWATVGLSANCRVPWEILRLGQSQTSMRWCNSMKESQSSLRMLLIHFQFSQHLEYIGCAFPRLRLSTFALLLIPQKRKKKKPQTSSQRHTHHDKCSFHSLANHSTYPSLNRPIYARTAGLKSFILLLSFEYFKNTSWIPVSPTHTEPPPFQPHPKPQS